MTQPNPNSQSRAQQLGISTASQNLKGSFSRNQTHHDSMQGITELEALLTQERKKFWEMKSGFESELDNVKRFKLELESRLLKLKDEYSKKTLEIVELQSREHSTLYSNQNLQIENEGLKNELKRQN